MNQIRSRVRVVTLALGLLVLTLGSTSPNWVRGQTGIFKITLMVPQPNPARQAWSLVIQNNLQSLGIDAGRVVLDWNTIYSKALTPAPSILGKKHTTKAGSTRSS